MVKQSEALHLNHNSETLNQDDNNYDKNGDKNGDENVNVMGLMPSKWLLDNVLWKDGDKVGDEDEEKELLCPLLLVYIQIHHH